MYRPVLNSINPTTSDQKLHKLLPSTRAFHFRKSFGLMALYGFKITSDQKTNLTWLVLLLAKSFLSSQQR